MKKVTTDQLLLDNVNKDAKKSKIVGFLLILFAGLIQFLGVLDFNIQGFRVMVVLIGVILLVQGFCSYWEVIQFLKIEKNLLNVSRKRC